jgi:hypothetical protein
MLSDLAMSAHHSQDGLQKSKDSTLNVGSLPEPTFFAYDQFILFGDSITQSDGDPALNFSCIQALQHGMCPRSCS